MGKLCLAVMVLCLNSLFVHAQTDFSLQNICQLGLPVVSITTVDNEEPTCEYVTHPEGSMGEGITNATKVPCRIVILNGENTVYDSGDYVKGESGATIKINGNTSAYHDNKPYKIKLQAKADLLFRGNKKYKDKEWRLLKDARTLNTMIGLKMNELMGLPWTPAYQACNVFINNDYRGCYLLIESVKCNNDCRLDVDKQTGFIVERDPYWWNEDVYFDTDYFAVNNSYRWTWKYPDEDDVTEEQTLHVQACLNQAEKSIKEGNYEEKIDVNSFASWVLAHDILGTWDSGGSNLYVMKYDNTDETLLQMANMWDFDTIFSIPNGSFSRIHTGAVDFYFNALFSSNNKAFVRTYKEKWNAVKGNIAQQVIDFINQYAASEEGQALQTSREYYSARWDKELSTVSEDAEEMTEWFTNHMPLLDVAISNLDDGTSSIHDLKLNDDTDNTNITYNLKGQQVITPRKGIYIVNGKKLMVR